MVRLASAFLLICSALVLSSADGGEKKGKEVTLKGKLTCAKCDLGVEKACTTVFVTKKDDKETVYYVDKDAHKKYHAEICTEAKEGEVKGVLTKDKDGKKNLITVKELKFN